MNTRGLQYPGLQIQGFPCKNWLIYCSNWVWKSLRGFQLLHVPFHYFSTKFNFVLLRSKTCFKMITIMIMITRNHQRRLTLMREIVLWINQVSQNISWKMAVTLCIIIDQTPIFNFCSILDLSENNLSYVNRWYLIF